TCTMNIRYTVMSVFTGVIFLAILLQSLKSVSTRPKKIISILISSVMVIFCLLSVVVYLKIGYIPAVYDGVVLK
ncbi:MAG: hypothetical protein IJU14_03250, partial [Clostridia bacterium]|nr:hypothetical protein [Clostridia bacterium]